jgi:hypothetical protein
MRHPGENRASEKALLALERQRQALELRKAGVGFQQIADQLGYGGPSGAFNAVARALQKVIQEPAEAVLALELARLDAMLLGLWPKARAGHASAVDRVLKLMDRRAKYLGLDAPVKVDLRQVVREMGETYGLTPDELATLQLDVTAFLAESKAAS